MRYVTLLSSVFFPKSLRIHARAYPETGQRKLPAAQVRGDRVRSHALAMTLRRPPSPLHLFIHHAEYRKWTSSKIMLGASPILSSRFHSEY
jgi:hypothetical protein